MSAGTSLAPERYELVVPQGWWSIDLDPAHRDANVAALVDHQWRGIDDAPHLKAEAREELGRQAAEAVASGGLQLFVSVGTLAGVPLSASLLVSAAPLASPDELSDLARSRSAEGKDVSETVLPAGRALRTRWRVAAVPDDETGAQPATTCLDLHVPVPGASRVLLLQFRTHLEPLAEPLVELFDAVAATLRWTGSAPRRSAGPVPDRTPRPSASEEMLP